jgi:hypothetical protein
LQRYWKIIVVTAALGAWFFGNAWRGLLAYFNGDDMMNLYQAWDFPLRHLIIANLTPFTKVYRPAGAAYYRLMYDVFGLHPLPFRIATYCLLALNIALLYWLAKLLSKSTEIGILTALIGAYHNRAMPIYISGGTIYDILCFSFYVLAMCVYIRARRDGGALNGKWLALFIVLNVLALNSKEMASTLPLVLLAYEVLYHVAPGLVRPRQDGESTSPTLTGGPKVRPGEIWRSWALWVSLAMTVVVAKIRTGAGTAFTGNPEYAMHLSVHQFFMTTRVLFDDLFVLRPGTFNTAKVVLVFAAVWAIAMVSRRRDLLLCAFIITVTPLPINFITPRGLFVMYLPLIGWSMFAAIVAVTGRDWLLTHIWHRPALPRGTWEPERVGLFLMVLYVLFNVQSHDQQRSILDPDGPQIRIRSLNESLARMHLPVPRGGSVLFVSDEFRTYDQYMPLFVVRLFYHDPKLAVDLEPMDRTYDRVLGLCGEGYCEVKR